MTARCRELPPAIQRSGHSRRTESDNPPPSGMAEEMTFMATFLTGRSVLIADRGQFCYQVFI